MLHVKNIHKDIGKNYESDKCEKRYTVFPLLQAAASNFFDELPVRFQFEGGYYSRAASKGKIT